MGQRGRAAELLRSRGAGPFWFQAGWAIATRPGAATGGFESIFMLR